MGKGNEKVKQEKEKMSETAKNILFFLVMGLIISLIFTGNFIYKHGNPIHLNEARGNDGDSIQVYINYSAHAEWDITYDCYYSIRFDDNKNQTVFSYISDDLHSHGDRHLIHGSCLLSSEIYDELLQMVNEEDLAQDRISDSYMGRPLNLDGISYPVLIVVTSDDGYGFYYTDSSVIVDRCEELEQFLEFDQ